MNKFEERSEAQRRSAIRSGLTIGTAGIALLVVVFLIFGLNSSAPPRYFSGVAVVGAIVLLVLRQLSRRMKGKAPRSAQPDPKSALNLD